MKLFHNTRKYFGNYDLKRKAKQLTRTSRIHNFTTAGKAGIVFICDTEEEFNAVKDFKQFLESESIKTEVVGYVSDKQVPDHFLLRTGYNFFCQRDLTWYYKPELPVIQGFMKQDFDILFDLSLKDYFPVSYMVKLSPASYKIGRYTDSGKYDLMIDIKENNSVSYLIEQIRHYLSILHTTKGTVRAS